MLIHPNFDPNIFAFEGIPIIGRLAATWYGLTYIVGFILFFLLGKKRIRAGNPIFKNTEQLDSLLTYGVLGVILGGRLGYVFFYKTSYYLSNPIDILKFTEGGMSFHGGLIGVIIAIWFFSLKNKMKFVHVSDFVAPLVPLGLGSGRIGNFINGELWGRVTHPDNWWAMGFQYAERADAKVISSLPTLFQNAYHQYGMLPRHPSQLYEFFLEGLVLFLILWLYSSKKRITGQVSALFLIFYGLFRFIIEYSREPDDHLGILSLGLTMGQWLSLPMFIIGLIWFVRISTRKKIALF